MMMMMMQKRTRLLLLWWVVECASKTFLWGGILSRVEMAAAFASTSSSSNAILHARPNHAISRKRKRTDNNNRLQVVTDPTTLDSSSSSSTDDKISSPKQSSRTVRVSKTGAESATAPTTATKTFLPPSSSSSTTTSSSSLVTGVVGNWENLHGNWVLRPYSNTASSMDDDPPRAVIHFLGGALVGAAPQITYRYLLEKLADKGFLIVATPYNLSFDHLATCDEVLTKFEDLAPTLARQYGALPVVGLGHSCGALLHLLITCLFPDTPRAANALLSFNNKPVSEAVPFFEEFFAPVFTSLAAPTVINADGAKVDGPSSNDSLIVGLKLAMAATQGRLPSDELLQEAQRTFRPNLGPPGFPIPFPEIPIPPFFSGSDKSNPIKIPKEFREAFNQWVSPSVSQLKDAGVLPLIHETIISLEQIPKLVDEVSRGYKNGVADGARDFNPTPALVRAAAGKAYRARRTLILGYEDDPIDESDEVEEVLREALSITRMRRPMIEIDVQRKTLSGGHEAPLVAPPLEVAERAEDLLGPESSREVLGYASASATADDLVRWLEEGNL